MFPSKSFLFCVPFCFFIPPCLLCIVVLTSYSFLSSDYEQQRQRVKFSHFFLLIFFFCTLGICFSDHTSLSFSFIHCHSWNVYLSILFFSFFFFKSIVHHGTTRTQTQLNLILTSVRFSADSHRCKGDICALIAGFSTHFNFNKNGYEHDQERNF